MELTATSQDHADLNGPGPFVVMAAADLAQLDIADAPAGVRLVRFDPPEPSNGDAGRLSVLGGRSPDQATTPLRHTPSAPCLFVASNAEARRQMEALSAWWGEHGPTEAPATLEIAVVAGDAAAGWQPVCAALLDLYAEQWHASARRETAAYAELSELRQEYERTRIAVEELRGLLHRLRMSRSQLGFAMPAGDDVIRPPGGAPQTSVELVQPLPVSAEGLVGIDLHFVVDQSDVRALGRLDVRLEAGENLRQLGRWHVPYHAAGRGWLRLALPAASAEPLHHLALRIRWESRSGPAPGLSVARFQRTPDLRAVFGETSIANGLAMRLWRSVPGTTISLQPEFWAEGGDAAAASGAEFEYELGPADFARVCQTTVGSPPGYFRLLEQERGIHLHPLRGCGPVSTASAVLPRACVEGVTRVVATVHIAGDNRRAPVEFAMCLTRQGSDHVGWPESLQSSTVVASSGWESVPPDGASHAVVLELPEPSETCCDLHFATRVPHGADNSYAWAEWSHVAICVAPAGDGAQRVSLGDGKEPAAMRASG